MGEKTNTEFKANIAWLFKAETIDRIFADEFDIGNRKTDQEQSEMKRYLSEKAQLAAQEKIRELKKEQEIQQQQNDYREKLKSFETLSHSQKETLKTEFKQSNFLQKKTAFWKEESEKSELDSVD